ncbi:hypothetical protein SAMN05444280_103190 [Tangfeifania diversioriginum]|uniref:Uncharacterized protein n=1 Tax=Tangfeifania diversioriginum TaxID=1168035 RepID=A0A1M6CAK4_9BACT|nr:hypothetical protein SAMN05444280_103190 [Tangfeifania diversioriginum]
MLKINQTHPGRKLAPTVTNHRNKDTHEDKK